MPTPLAQVLADRHDLLALTDAEAADTLSAPVPIPVNVTALRAFSLRQRPTLATQLGAIAANTQFMDEIRNAATAAVQLFEASDLTTLPLGSAERAQFVADLNTLSALFTEEQDDALSAFAFAPSPYSGTTAEDVAENRPKAGRIAAEREYRDDLHAYHAQLAAAWSAYIDTDQPAYLEDGTTINAWPTPPTLPE
jgi:hypothetical protein